MPPTLQDCWPRRSASLRSWVVFAAVVGMVVVEALFAMYSGGRRVGKGTPVAIVRRGIIADGRFEIVQWGHLACRAPDGRETVYPGSRKSPRPKPDPPIAGYSGRGALSGGRRQP